MSRKVKNRIVIILSSLYLIIFFSTIEMKMNIKKYAENENAIVQLKEKQSALEEKLQKLAENKKYNNDINNYILSINKQIADIKIQIQDYQSKIKELDNILKDN